MTLLSSTAHAARTFVTIRDDGFIAGFNMDDHRPYDLAASIAEQYEHAGAPPAQVLSVWTAFNVNRSFVETLYLPMANDVTGIGLEQYYQDDGTKTSEYPPIVAILSHNNVLQLAQRASIQRAPVEGIDEYLFLLELSHLWGPAVRIPGPTPNALIGFPFHWSFWLDAGGSPAGGNRWMANGDGTYTTALQTPGGVEFSMLDLYLMGLADASEVPPFGLLESPVAPVGETDPFSAGKPYSAKSFPRFDPTPLTVTASRREVSVDEIIAQNGMRMPAFGDAPTTLTLGIVLFVEQDASDDEVAAAEAVMEPVASRLAPAFHRATKTRGTLDVVTIPPAPPPDLGASDAGSPPPPPSSCSYSPGRV